MAIGINRADDHQRLATIAVGKQHRGWTPAIDSVNNSANNSANDPANDPANDSATGIGHRSHRSLSTILAPPAFTLILRPVADGDAMPSMTVARQISGPATPRDGLRRKT